VLGFITTAFDALKTFLFIMNISVLTDMHSQQKHSKNFSFIGCLRARFATTTTTKKGGKKLLHLCFQCLPRFWHPVWAHNLITTKVGSAYTCLVMASFFDGCLRGEDGSW
jgi:hypothetical protein